MKSKNEKDFTIRLGKQIALVRKAQGITQEALAQRASLDRMTIALVETGKKRPSISTVYKLAVILEVETKDFFENL